MSTPTAGHDLTGPSWSTEDIDVQSYFAVLGITPDPEASLSQLERIQGAHVRALPFSNVDVLLQQHPGISPSDVSTRLLHESRGGMCFEHTQLMAAALESLGYSLGYTVERRLGRVHEVTNSRTPGGPRREPRWSSLPVGPRLRPQFHGPTGTRRRS